MTSLAYNKHKGARFETRAAERLAALTGLPVERRHLNGVHDRGDLAGVTLRGHRIVVECKNTAGMNNIPQFLREASREAVNDGALVGVVVKKRDRISIETDAGMDAQYVVMTFVDFATIIAAANGRDTENA